MWLGSNDSCTHFSSTPSLHVPLAAFTANMRHIVHALQSRDPATALLLVTPLDQAHWLAYRRFKYGASAPLSLPLPRMQYVEAVRSLGKECGVAVCDVSSEVLRAEQNKDWSVDGVHLNALGNERVFAAVVAAVEHNWPELAAQKLPVDGYT